ncbi:MPT63 family protein [Mycobacterium sp. C31M]
MKTTSIAAAFAAAAVAAAGAITAFSAPTAFADDHSATVTTTQLGSQAELHDGNVVQGWTVTGLKVSTDTIPAEIHGTLWEATATDEALEGSATPIVSNFNARARNGDTYRALFGVATAQGVNPSTLSQGQQTSGKVYFDVTGEAPDSVVYATNAADLIVWLTPPPAASTGTGASTGTRTYQAPAAAEATEGTEATTTETTTTETPAAEAGESTETTETPAPGEPTTAPAGSVGTPLPEGTPETAPAPAGSVGTPLPEGQPGLTPAGVQEASVPGAPAPAAVPAPEGTVPAPAAAPAPEPVAQAEVGSQGTPLPAGAAPVTTPVPAPPA